MSYQNLLLEQPESGIYVLTVNRPQALNALNAATLDELARAVAQVAAAAGARVLLVTGAGDKAFVAGADISEMQQLTAVQAQAFSEQGMQVMHALEALPIPVIALVQGYALGGGCELAMACDWIIAGERAVFGQPEVNLGIPPGFGGTQRLTRLVGRARALELVTTARQIKAEEALAIGLVHDLQWRRVRLDDVDADPQRAAVRHSGHAPDRGPPGRPQWPGRDPPNDVSGAELRSPHRRRQGGGNLPGARQGMPRRPAALRTGALRAAWYPGAASGRGWPE